jgi:hypothetical protein
MEAITMIVTATVMLNRRMGSSLSLRRLHHVAVAAGATSGIAPRHPADTIERLPSKVAIAVLDFVLGPLVENPTGPGNHSAEA